MMPDTSHTAEFLAEPILDDPLSPTSYAATDHSMAMPLDDTDERIPDWTPDQPSSSSLNSSAVTTAAINPAILTTTLPTLLARISQIVCSLSSLPPPPSYATPIIYSALLPFARRNDDEMTIFLAKKDEAVNERDVQFHEWKGTQDYMEAYEHWLPRSEETQARWLQSSKSRSRARQAAYMRRSQYTSWSKAVVRASSSLHSEVDDDDLGEPPIVVSGTEENSNDADVLDDFESAWEEEWDESLSFSSDDYEELGGTGDGNRESTAWREKPMPLDERFELIYGPSDIFGPRAASLMGFPDSSWALWLPSETGDNVETATGAHNDIVRTSGAHAKAASVPVNKAQDEAAHMRSIDSEDIADCPKPFHRPHQVQELPVCAARLAVRAHSGTLPERSFLSAQMRAAASLHLKLAAWVLTKIKLDESDITGHLNPSEGRQDLGALNQNIGIEDGSTEDSTRRSVTTPTDSVHKRGREEDDGVDGVDGTRLQQELARPIKRNRL